MLIRIAARHPRFSEGKRHRDYVRRVQLTGSPRDRQPKPGRGIDRRLARGARQGAEQCDAIVESTAVIQIKMEWTVHRIMFMETLYCGGCGRSDAMKRNPSTCDCCTNAPLHSCGELDNVGRRHFRGRPIA